MVALSRLGFPRPAFGGTRSSASVHTIPCFDLMLLAHICGFVHVLRISFEALALHVRTANNHGVLPIRIPVGYSRSPSSELREPERSIFRSVAQLPFLPSAMVLLHSSSLDPSMEECRCEHDETSNGPGAYMSPSPCGRIPCRDYQPRRRAVRVHGCAPP